MPKLLNDKEITDLHLKGKSFGGPVPMARDLDDSESQAIAKALADTARANAAVMRQLDELGKRVGELQKEFSETMTIQVYVMEQMAAKLEAIGNKMPTAYDLVTSRGVDGKISRVKMVPTPKK